MGRHPRATRALHPAAAEANSSPQPPLERGKAIFGISSAENQRIAFMSWHEELEDQVGVRLPGAGWSERLARELRENTNHASMFEALCGGLAPNLARGSNVISISRSAGGRSVEKITACASDAIRYAMDICTGTTGVALIAFATYVGGDPDQACMAASQDGSEATPDERCVLPMPYQREAAANPSADAARLEHDCIQSLHQLVLAGSLRGRPVRAVLLDLVNGSCGLAVRHGFLERLGRHCKALGVRIVLDETLTWARTSGLVEGRPAAGAKSLLALDALPAHIAEALDPRYVVGGKSLSIGVVWVGKPGTAAEQGRGWSTGVGDDRLDYAAAVATYLLEKATPEALAEVRARCERMLTHAGARHGIECWGQGLLLFSSVRLSARGRAQNYTTGRMLPTLGVLEWGEEFFVPSPVEPSGCDPGRLVSRQTKRAIVAAAVRADAWHAVAGAVLTLRLQPARAKRVMQQDLRDLVAQAGTLPREDVDAATAQAFRLLRETRSKVPNASRTYRLDVVSPADAGPD